MVNTAMTGGSGATAIGQAAVIAVAIAGATPVVSVGLWSARPSPAPARWRQRLSWATLGLAGARDAVGMRIRPLPAAGVSAALALSGTGTAS